MKHQDILVDTNFVEQEESRKRRLQRLEQVRKQSRDFAAVIRERVRSNSIKRFKAEEDKLIEDVKVQKMAELANLRQQYFNYIENIHSNKDNMVHSKTRSFRSPKITKVSKKILSANTGVRSICDSHTTSKIASQPSGGNMKSNRQQCDGDRRVIFREDISLDSNSTSTNNSSIIMFHSESKTDSDTSSSFTSNTCCIVQNGVFPHNCRCTRHCNKENTLRSRNSAWDNFRQFCDIPGSDRLGNNRSYTSAMDTSNIGTHKFLHDKIRNLELQERVLRNRPLILDMKRSVSQRSTDLAKLNSLSKLRDGNNENMSLLSHMNDKQPDKIIHVGVSGVTRNVCQDTEVVSDEKFPECKMHPKVQSASQLVIQSVCRNNRNSTNIGGAMEDEKEPVDALTKEIRGRLRCYSESSSVNRLRQMSLKQDVTDQTAKHRINRTINSIREKCRKLNEGPKEMHHHKRHKSNCPKAGVHTVDKTATVQSSTDSEVQNTAANVEGNTEEKSRNAADNADAFIGGTDKTANAVEGESCKACKFYKSVQVVVNVNTAAGSATQPPSVTTVKHDNVCERHKLLQDEGNTRNRDWRKVFQDEDKMTESSYFSPPENLAKKKEKKTDLQQGQRAREKLECLVRKLLTMTRESVDRLDVSSSTVSESFSDTKPVCADPGVVRRDIRLSKVDRTCAGGRAQLETKTDLRTEVEVDSKFLNTASADQREGIRNFVKSSVEMGEQVGTIPISVGKTGQREAFSRRAESSSVKRRLTRGSSRRVTHEQVTEETKQETVVQSAGEDEELPECMDDDESRYYAAIIEKLCNDSDDLLGMMPDTTMTSETNLNGMSNDPLRIKTETSTGVTRYRRSKKEDVEGIDSVSQTEKDDESGADGSELDKFADDHPESHKPASRGTLTSQSVHLRSKYIADIDANTEGKVVAKIDAKRLESKLQRLDEDEEIPGTEDMLEIGLIQKPFKFERGGGARPDCRNPVEDSSGNKSDEEEVNRRVLEVVSEISSILSSSDSSSSKEDKLKKICKAINIPWIDSTLQKTRETSALGSSTSSSDAEMRTFAKAHRFKINNNNNQLFKGSDGFHLVSGFFKPNQILSPIDFLNDSGLQLMPEPCRNKENFDKQKESTPSKGKMPIIETDFSDLDDVSNIDSESLADIAKEKEPGFYTD